MQNIYLHPLLILLSLISCTTAPRDLPEDFSIEISHETIGDVEIYDLKQYGIIVARIPGITKYLYATSDDQSAAKVALDSNYTLVVNGSYFDYASRRPGSSPDAYFIHAGYLKIDDSIYTPLQEDSQLTGLLVFNSLSGACAILDTAEMEAAKNYDLVVQTGPPIIRDGQIDRKAINVSVNGKIPNYRTALATGDNQDIYLIITHSGRANAKYRLDDLGSILLQSGLFNDSLDVINLDGGSSTSLFVKDHPELCFHSGREILPLFICVD